MMSAFVLKNGKFHVSSEKFFGLEGQNCFLFSEKIRAIRNSFPFFQETLDLLLLKFRILNQSIPDFMAANGHELKRQMERLLVKNKLFKSAIIELSFFRNGADTDYFLSARGFESTTFELNTKGLIVEAFDKINKAVSDFSNLALGSESVWQIAKLHLSFSVVDEFLIFNSEQKIIEGIGKKLLLVTGNKLQGVSHSAGAYMDVTSPIIPEIAQKIELDYSECDGFTIEELLQADELFFIDALHGVQWILGLGDKRYYQSKVRLFCEEMNRMFVS